MVPEKLPVVGGCCLRAPEGFVTGLGVLPTGVKRSQTSCQFVDLFIIGFYRTCWF